jgi:hypothetical protein
VWSPEVAYAVGLIATDGCLSRDGRHVTVSSKDTDLLETLRQCLGLRASVTPYGAGSRCHHVQWSDRRFYDWLVGIGLSPAKSLTLGRLSIPDAHFADFFRGCIDGDGSIVVYVDRYHAAKNERYVYQRLYLSLVSASRPFVDWIRATLQQLITVDGSIAMQRHRPRLVYVLRYAKHESLRLLSWMYYARNVACLDRKRRKAEPFLFRQS